MRVCVVSINYSPERSGIGPYTTGMAVGLAARGHDVQVLTGLPHYPEWRVNSAHRELSGKVQSMDGVVVRRFAHYVPSDPTTRRRLLFESTFGIRAVSFPWGRPDVVLTTSPSLIASAMAIARSKVANVPVGIIVHDLYGKGVIETGVMSGRMARAVRRFEAWVLKQATGAAVVHERFETAAIQAGVDPRRITVIRNWAHVEAAGPVNISEVRAKHGWSTDDRIVIHSGNMGAKQGLENVVEAARLADQQQVNIRFILVGNGHQRRALERRAQGIVRIEFTDSLEMDDYRQVLASADVLLVSERPGVEEMAVPSKLTTYFAAGRPIVAATHTGGVTAQEIKDSGAGVIVAAGDPTALLGTCVNLADDFGAAKRFGTSGQRYARRLLGVDRAIDEYDEWCHRLVARSPQ